MGVMDISKAIREVSATYSFDAEKFKFKCSSYAGHGYRLHFIVRIYTVNEENGKYIVELSKRSGCCMHWKKIYKALLAASVCGNSTSMEGDIPMDAFDAE